jgi:hypothetical protein
MSRLRSLVRSDLFLAVLAGLTALTVYLRTLAPGVSIIDSGELSAVACTLGIAHPTGYPLFTLLGRIAAMLPVGPEAIVRLNAMAALCAAAGVGVLCHLLASLLRMMSRESARDRARAAAVGPAALGGALVFGFSDTVWAQGVAIEVYALHLLLVALILRMAVWALEARDRQENREVARAWLMGAFLLGLSFGNHMTTVLLLPALAVWFLGTAGGGVAGRRLALRAALSGGAGLSIYLYLPLRAAQHPAFSWGDVTSIERLLWHISGKQYRVWIFSSWDVAERQLKAFLADLPAEFTVVGLLLAALGLLVMLRWQLRPALVTVLLWVTCVGYAINYDIHDIDAYFLLAYLVIALWISVGIVFLVRLLPRRVPVVALWLGALLLPAGMLLGKYASADRSGDYMVEDYTRAVFEAVEPGGVVLSYQWDFWLSASYYYQSVEGWRTDVTVVDKELLRRSWYLTELERRSPELMRTIAPKTDAFRTELDRFEHGLAYNGAVIQARFVGMITALVRNALATRPVYVTAEIEPEFTAGLQRVPVGPVFRLYEDTLFHPTPRPEFSYRPIVRDDDYGRRLLGMYAEALMARGRYYLAQGEVREAQECFREAAQHAPAGAAISSK